MEKDNNPEDVKLQIEPLISSDSPIRSHSFSVPQSHDSTPGNSEVKGNGGVYLFQVTAKKKRIN